MKQKLYALLTVITFLFGANSVLATESSALYQDRLNYKNLISLYVNALYGISTKGDAKVGSCHIKAQLKPQADYVSLDDLQIISEQAGTACQLGLNAIKQVKLPHASKEVYTNLEDLIFKFEVRASGVNFSNRKKDEVLDYDIRIARSAGSLNVTSAEDLADNYREQIAQIVNFEFDNLELSEDNSGNVCRISAQIDQQGKIVNTVVEKDPMSDPKVCNKTTRIFERLKRLPPPPTSIYHEVSHLSFAFEM